MRRAALLVLAGGCVGASGCARVAMPPEPAPMEPPRVVMEPPSLDLPPPVPVDLPTEAPAPLDPILDSPWTDHPRFRDEVERWVDFWTGREGDWFPVYLERMGAYEHLVDEALARRRLPPSLRYLPIIESGYLPSAVSRASAVGMWQLMAPTARSSGMRVGELVDERRDPVRATEVALDYLKYLNGRFDSWFLALAAYNAGPSRVDRLLDEHAPGTKPNDALFWLILDDLPRETRDFVPRFVAAARIARDPAAHGMEPPAAAAPFVFDEVTVPDATSLDVVARAAGVSEREVELLNPQILRRVTPDRTTTSLRVPEGTGWRFNYEYARIPREERVTVTEHIVRKGETLWGIARRYGVAVAVLEEANPEVRPERMRPGVRLIVPLVPRAVASVGGS